VRAQEAKSASRCARMRAVPRVYAHSVREVREWRENGKAHQQSMLVAGAALVRGGASYGTEIL